MTIFLVEDDCNSPGRIYACFASEEDATFFAEALGYCIVTPRKLWYGQPPVKGYNE